MLVKIKEEKNSGIVAVDLTMEYEPENLLGVLAIPVLTVDNALALRVLFTVTQIQNNQPG